MRCHICNTLLREVDIHPQTGEIEPCDQCLGVVRETMDDYLMRDIQESEKDDDRDT